jgi:hypothetical protein
MVFSIEAVGTTNASTAVHRISVAATTAKTTALSHSRAGDFGFGFFFFLQKLKFISLVLLNE